jgi:hypothetical protein
MGPAPIVPLLLRLLVHDWYYVELTALAFLPYFQYYTVELVYDWYCMDFTEWASLPYFQYFSVY